MPPVCMFDILALPQDDLQRVLPKASSRSLAKLAVAYPRAAGRSFIEILALCMSERTVAFIRDEINGMQPPSYPEIRQAEQELIKIIRDEHLEDRVVSSPLATPHPQ
jgi:flagellar motor switch protein FliG